MSCADHNEHPPTYDTWVGCHPNYKADCNALFVPIFMFPTFHWRYPRAVTSSDGTTKSESYCATLGTNEDGNGIKIVSSEGCAKYAIVIGLECLIASGSGQITLCTLLLQRPFVCRLTLSPALTTK